MTKELDTSDFQESSELDWYQSEQKKDSEVVVEIDIYKPQGKDPNDWDFIKSEKFNVDVRDMDDITGYIGDAIRNAVVEWRTKKEDGKT